MTGDDTGDERITELFRTAASDAPAPPARFDHSDVVAASRRITARRRSAVLGGAMALLVVAGVGAVATLPQAGGGTVTAASSGVAGDQGSEERADRAAPEAAPRIAPAPIDAGATAPPGVVPSGAAPSGPATSAPLGPGSTACAESHDPALRALVAGLLPEVATAPDAPDGAAPGTCLPGTHRYLHVELVGGTLTVAYLPPGTIASLVPGARSAPTASGGTVILATPPAYRDREDALLAYLAPRL